MLKTLLVVLAALTAVGHPVQAQTQPAEVTAGDLIGTWTLLLADQGVDSGKPVSIPGPRGLLVFDSAGHVFETITRAPRQGATPGPQVDPAGLLAVYSGFWGLYTADMQVRTLTMQPLGAVSPNVMGAEFSRTFELRGDQLTITSRAGEPHTGPVTRWVWERVPNVENLSPAWRQVIGFWQHTGEGAMNLVTGVTSTTETRAPSVIVYTPAGYVGVHFPPSGRKRFAADTPTEAEAGAALRGYIGYFGALGLYPGMVFHQILAGISPAPGNTLKRNYEMKGDDLTISFRPLGTKPGDPNGMYVRLSRLSGEKEMLR